MINDSLVNLHYHDKSLRLDYNEIGATITHHEGDLVIDEPTGEFITFSDLEIRKDLIKGVYNLTRRTI